MLLDHSLGENNKEGIPDFDIFIASPDFGDKISRRGGGNFSLTDLYNCLGIISLKIPDYVLIAVSCSAISYLQIENRVVETYDEIPTNDLIIAKMKDMGYTAQTFIIDPVTYTLPQHKLTFFYFFAKDDIFEEPIRLPEKIYSPEKSAVCNWLKKIPKNGVTFNEFDFSKKEVCSKIKPGLNAKQTKDVSLTSGYIRLRGDKPCIDLGSDFYKVSSSSPSIHPYYDRPLTLREGAVLSGLPLEYDWGNKLKKQDVAKMIHKSVSPIIGGKIKMGLKHVFEV